MNNRWLKSSQVMRSNSGAVLVVVLGMLALLTIIAVSFVFATRMSLRASEAYMRSIVATDMAEAGMATAIYVLKEDKIFRTGDRLDESAPISETYDSLRDSWRQAFSSPVVITYPNTAADADLNVGDTVVNNNSGAAARYGAKAKVISIDKANDRLYLNSVSTGLWVAGDAIIEEDQSSAFNTTITAVSKPDEVDLDGDGTPDAVWHNFYDETGLLLGRYAVLIQDESSKINVNVSGNMLGPIEAHANNEGWSTFEIDIAKGLFDSGGGENAKSIIRYRHGTDDVPGLGNPNPDDNFNRYSYRNDGIDNDGDGDIDEADEGINEPEEFRPLRPYRTVAENLPADSTILVLEQLEDDEGVALEDFLQDPSLPRNLGDPGTITTTFDAASTPSTYDRRHFVSTSSHDRNLNWEGRLRVNPNFATPEQIITAVQSACAVYNDADQFEYPDLRNMQVAANIYDFRDRNRGRVELQDSAGNVFAGIEAIRINEVLVRAATSVYEAETASTVGGAAGNNWDTATAYGLTPPGNYGAKSPLPNGVWIEDFLRNVGTAAAAYEMSNTISIVLPDPPFSDSTPLYPYTFKLRMRVRSDGTASPADSGFEVYLNGSQVTGINSIYGAANPPGRWATLNSGASVNNWYVEEAIVQLNGAGAANTLYFQTPQATGGNTNVDTVDVDWLYFSQEPDCEWIELVNIGSQDISVLDWKLVSEYIVDTSNIGGAPTYTTVRHEVTLPDVEIPRITTAPQHKVFVIDYDDTAGSTATTNNAISFTRTWTNVAPAFVNYANVHQVTSIYNIYSSWIDFFGNEPLDDINNYTGPIGVRNEHFNIESGTISLYDSFDNLVDRITYVWDQVREGFRSLQKNHPANPGERRDSNLNFKMKAFAGTTWYPLADYSVTSDGNYDDWLFPWDRGPLPLAALPDPERYLWLWATPTKANNLYADTSATTQAGIHGEYDEINNFDNRVATPDCRVKDRYFSSVGELVHLPFYHDYVAAIAYEEPPGEDYDQDLVPGESVIVNTTLDPDQAVNLLSVHPTDITTATGEFGWMIVKGNAANNPNLWRKGDALTSGADFAAGILRVKPVDRLMGIELDHYIEIGYELDPVTPPPHPGVEEITNISKDPLEYGMVAVAPTNNFLQVRMDPHPPPPAAISDWSLSKWKVGETIQYGAGPYTATITSVREKTADVQNLADYFSTASINLAAAAASVYEGTNFARVRWPDSVNDPHVFRIEEGETLEKIEWNEDAGVQEGTFDLYHILNYGSDIESEVAIYAGPVTIRKTSPFQQAKLTLENAAAAAAEYHFMGAVLAPPPYTFGRINPNTASHRVLQGLRLELPDPDNPEQPDAGSPARSDYATAIIQARNIAAFESIGDLYRVSELEIGTNGYMFTPEVFKNISNLITTRSDAYKIIVIGQGVSDANNDGIVQDTEIISEKKLEMLYQR